MKHIIFPIIFIAAHLFCSNSSVAQTGWKWGKGSEGCFYEQQGSMLVEKHGKGIFVAGYNENSAFTVFGPDTVFNNTFNKQMIVTKLDSLGGFLWNVATQNTDAYPLSMAGDAGGNLYVLGYYDSSICNIGSVSLNNSPNPIPFSTDYGMYFLTKISSSGVVLWSVNVTQGEGWASIATDAAGYIYVTGYFAGDTAVIGTDTVVDGDPTGSNDNIFIAKFDSAGNTVWARDYGGMQFSQARLITVSSQGNLFICGQFTDTLRIGPSVVVDTAAAAGAWPPQFYAKFDSSGSPLWAKNLTQRLIPFGIATDACENLYMTGNVDTVFMAIGTDTIQTGGYWGAFTTKIRSSGDIAWIKYASGGVIPGESQIAVDYCGNAWIVGSMGLVVPNIMHFGTVSLPTPPGSNDPMFAAEYDSSGAYVTSLALTSGGDDYSAIDLDDNGNVYIGADYYSGYDMIIGPDTLYNDFTEALLVAKYRYTTSMCIPVNCTTDTSSATTVAALPSPGEISLYPNPATNEFTISSWAPFQPGARAMLYDITGRLVSKTVLSGNSTVISVAGMSAGMYQCRIISGDLAITRKVVVMK